MRTGEEPDCERVQASAAAAVQPAAENETLGGGQALGGLCVAPQAQGIDYIPVGLKYGASRSPNPCNCDTPGEMRAELAAAEGLWTLVQLGWERNLRPVRAPIAT